MAGSMHGREHAWQGACMAGDMHGRGHAWQGTCMAGSMHSSEYMAGEGMCGGGRAWGAGQMATETGGTHPTGMHSCSCVHFLERYSIIFDPANNVLVTTITCLQRTLFLRKRGPV